MDGRDREVRCAGDGVRGQVGGVPVGEGGAARAAGRWGRRAKRALASEAEILAAAREAHGRRPGPMTLEEFERLTGGRISGWWVPRVFAGGWTEVRKRAGIPLHPREENRRSDEELLAEFHRVACELGRVPRWTDLKRRGRVSEAPYRDRFGGKPELEGRYGEWLKQHEPGSAFLAEIEAGRRRKARGRKGAERGSACLGGGLGGGLGVHGGLAGSGPVCGEVIEFRCLAHAPTNEKGVLVLFGMLAEELGFRIEAVGTGFPDCVAKRALDAGRTQWQQVRIEFEYRSRNFRDHGHDAAGCDLVVCWRHDWAECPVGVLELSEVVRGGGRRAGEGVSG